MTYQSFISELNSVAAESLPENTGISFESFRQNNGITKNALIISTESSNIKPIIYLDEYFTRYKKGEDISNILSDIISTYEKYRIYTNIDLPLYDFNWVKNKIIYRLINYKRNFPLLCEIPHIKFLDLAIVFNICIFKKDIYSIAAIDNSHIKNWDIGVNTMLEYAGKNTPKLLPENVHRFSDILKDTSVNDITSNPLDMYVLTNSICTYGASCILYSRVLEKLAEKFNEDIYILPSSVHELILLPCKDKNSRELHDMVFSINETAPKQTEILSNHVYLYERNTGKILF